MSRFFNTLALIGWLSSSLVHGQPIDSIFHDAVSKGFSGEILVLKNGKTLYHEARGFLSFEQGSTLKKGDLYEWASVSKQFTAMVIMKLADKGQLGFDDPVEKYLSIPYKGITIRHLLTHTSGLPDYQAIMDAHWDKQKVAGNTDIIDYLNLYMPARNFAPGEKYEYSNTGYVLLASIAEKASGEDFISLARRLIFKPLKMKHAGIRTLEEKASTPRFTYGHIKDSTGAYVHAGLFRNSDYTIWLGNRRGPGRVSGNAQDLAQWDKGLYRPRFINPEMLTQAFSPAVLNDGTLSGYGFGWTIDTARNGSPIVKHSGDNPGYQTQIVRMTGSRTVIILLNNNYYPGFARLVESLVNLFQ